MNIDMSAGALDRALEPSLFSDNSAPFSPAHGRKRSYTDLYTTDYHSQPSSACSSSKYSPSSSNLFGSPQSHLSSPSSSVPSHSPSSNCISLPPISEFDDRSMYDQGSMSPFEALLATPKADCVKTDVKRRKTGPSDLSPVKSPRRSPNKRVVGNDGEVWAPDVEDAFMTALTIVPKLGRRKVLVNNKPCGRNELITDYIHRKTGKYRTRKQVSSHIQVLKNLRRDDEHFMSLVADAVEGVDDTFTPEAIALFGGSVQLLPGSPGSPSGPTFSYPENRLSPLLGNPPTAPNMMYRSNSMDQLSPAMSDCSSFSPAPSAFGSPYAASANLATSPALASAFKDSFSFPSSQPERVKVPLMPSHLSITGPITGTDSTHIFARLNLDKTCDAISDTVQLEDLSSYSTRFPGIVNMHDYLPCQFLHVKLNLSLPQAEDKVDVKDIAIQMLLSAQQEMNVTAVTTVYQDGATVSLDSEALPSAERLSSPDGSPEDFSPRSARHRYAYAAPFMSTFWTNYLGTSLDGNGMPVRSAQRNFAKTPAQRATLRADMATLTAVQEFVVPAEEGAPAVESGLSAGSGLGDVVLVVLYEFEILESVGRVAPPASAKVSLISRKANAQKPAMPKLARPATAPRRPSMLSHSSTSSSDQSIPSIKLEDNDEAVPVSSIERPTRPVLGKPNLSLRIPLPSMNVTTPLHTPLPQEMGGNGPAAPPPPGPGPSSPASRRRLARLWKQQSGDFNLDSPALQTNFRHEELSMPSHTKTVQQGVNQLSWMTADAMSMPTPNFGCYSNANFGLAIGTPFHAPQPQSQPTEQDSYFASYVNYDA